MVLAHRDDFASSSDLFHLHGYSGCLTSSGSVGFFFVGVRLFFKKKYVCSPEASRVARGSASDPPAAIPYDTGAVPRAFGRDDGGEAAGWHDGEAGPAGAVSNQGLGNCEDQGPEGSGPAGHGQAARGGMRPNRGGRARHLP